MKKEPNFGLNLIHIVYASKKTQQTQNQLKLVIDTLGVIY